MAHRVTFTITNRRPRLFRASKRAEAKAALVERLIARSRKRRRRNPTAPTERGRRLAALLRRAHAEPFKRGGHARTLLARALGRHMSRKVSNPSYVYRGRRYETEYVVQGNYGQGWEDVDSHETKAEAVASRKNYDANEPYPHRVKYKRSKGVKVNPRRRRR